MKTESLFIIVEQEDSNFFGKNVNPMFLRKLYSFGEQIVPL